MNAGLSITYGATSAGSADSSQKANAAQKDPLQAPESLCSTDGCTHLRAGKELLEKGKFSDSIENLKKALKELPLVGDYVLFFMAKAHAKAGNFDDAEGYIHELLRIYPDSLLKKKARALEIRNIIAKSTVMAKKENNDADIKTLEKYVTSYPDDTEMKFLLGQILKKSGKKEQAKKLFKDIYITSGSFAEPACKELEPSDVTAQDMLTRASNLVKEMDYKKAETLLRQTLSVADDALRDDVEKKLGIVLFGQKKYREAAAEFSNASDTYNAARSFYRAGEVEAFQTAVSKLTSMEDRRAASLLIAFAAKKRREGKTEEALGIYRGVTNAFPSHAEEALWGTAWTYYRAGNSEASLKVLNELDKAHPSSRYLYWKAKCLEALAKSGTFPEGEATALSVFNELGEKKNDFYGILAQMHDKDYVMNSRSFPAMPADFVATQQTSCAQTGAGFSEDTTRAFPSHQQGYSPPLRINHPLSRSLERFVILLSIGMKEDAIAELTSSPEFSSPDEFLSVCSALQESGDYKSAIALSSRLTAQGKNGIDINDILYPMAFWPIVQEAAKNATVDPYILLSVMREESRFDPDARSEAGAVGLMQVLPQTADTISRRVAIKTLKSEIRDVRTNITLGSYYLGVLMEEFGSLPLAIAAYNAGEERIREWLRQGNYVSYDDFIEDIPYDETRIYVKKVLTTYATYKQKAAQDLSVCTRNESP
jgi:soluble lytic murein transglycosylase